MKTVIYKLMPAGPAEAFAVLDLDESLRYAVERGQLMQIPVWPVPVVQPYFPDDSPRVLMLQFSRFTFPAGHSVLAGFTDGIGAAYMSKLFPPHFWNVAPSADQVDFYRALRAAAGAARQ